MQEWKRHLKRGKDKLAHHDPSEALRELQMAIESCPVDENRNLEKVLFYTGITLQKLGIPNGALKSWVIARKVKKHGYSSKMIKRFSNGYGMVRQLNTDLDDWKAFYSIQLGKYLKEKGTGAIDTREEYELVKEKICEAWCEVCERFSLRDMTIEEKLHIFETAEFNTGGEDTGSIDPGASIYVNFRQNRRFSAVDRCSCGSGLQFSMCCGRILGEDELLNGNI